MLKGFRTAAYKTDLYRLKSEAELFGGIMGLEFRQILEGSHVI